MNTLLITRLHEEVIVKAVMLPQSAKDESASYGLGYALTVSWVTTRPRTYRNPPYIDGRIREKYRGDVV